MKKLYYRRKCYLDSKSRRCLQKTRVNSSVYRKRKKIKNTNSIYKKKKNLLVVAPEVIRINKQEDHKKFNEFISKIEQGLKDGKTIRIRLSGIKELWPCGTLVFLARIDIWLKNFPNKLQAIDYPSNPEAEELLQHVGTLQKLNLSNRRLITSENVRFWHYKSGSDTDPEAYQSLTETIIANIEHEEAPLFADCLNEAVNNSVAHAYKATALPHLYLKNWWILSELKDDKVFVAIYDSGVTIPKSIRRKRDWMLLLGGRNWKDSKLLEAAVSSLRTRTDLPERGKGLPEMLEFSQKLSSGGLSILSGKAYFHYNSNTQKQKRANVVFSIPGTLILWSIPFQEMRSAND